MLESFTNEVLLAVVVAVLTLLFFMIKKPSKVSSLKAARSAIRQMIDEKNCHPIMVRLAWHDSGTYDKSQKGAKFSLSGGADGSIIHSPEIGHGANAGLSKAVNYLRPIKAQFPTISWADLIQMASAEAIELAGGPKISMRYGRIDATAEECPKEGNLPAAAAPFADGSADAAAHLRKVFYRMGFSDQEIVALSGAHTIGRAFKNRSGTTDKDETKFTCPAFRARADGKEGIGMKGGQSWTPKWLSFDNSYFTCERSPELLRLETDSALELDPSFKKFYAQYAHDQEAFFKDYAAVHKKLSELGSVFEPREGIILD